MSLTSKRICITGGAGFIGSHLVQRLIEDNEIVVYDNLHRNALQFAHLEDHPHLHFIKGDVMDYEATRRALDGCQVVIHCAAIAGVYSVDRNAVTDDGSEHARHPPGGQGGARRRRRAVRRVLDERGLRPVHPQGQGRRSRRRSARSARADGSTRRASWRPSTCRTRTTRRTACRSRSSARSTSTARGRSATARSAG